MRLLVVRNPSSGTAGRRASVDTLIERLREWGAEVDVVEPASADETQKAAAGARRDQHDGLVAAGGDGTLHTIANGLAATPKAERPALAILPAGRGNDFAAELGFHSAEDTFAAITNGSRGFVDLGKAGGRVFLGVAGAGFDAQTARRAQDTPILTGSLLYSYAVFRTLLDFQHVEAHIRFDGGSFEGPITFAAVGNSRRYGGGMHIAPEAQLADGLLDLCLVRDISRSTLLYMFPTVFKGTHLSHPRVNYQKTKFVEIETNEPAEIFGDGEFLQTTPARIEILPTELEVFTPDASKR